MPIGIVYGTLKVENIRVREYQTFSPIWGFDPEPSNPVLTPYIRHTGTPLITWQIVGQSPTPAPIYKVQLIWLGQPSAPVEETEIDTGFTVFNTFYAVGVFESLKHIQANDAGSIYRILVIAQQGVDQDIAGGVFAVNFRPTRPVNLTIT